MLASPGGNCSACCEFQPWLPLKMLNTELIEPKLFLAQKTEVSFVAAVFAWEGGEHSTSGPIR